MFDKNRWRRAKARATSKVLSGSLGGDSRGQMAISASGVVQLVVALTVGALVGAFLFPIAINEIAGVDTSSWSSGAASLWGIMGTIIVLALFLYFVSLATDRL